MPALTGMTISLFVRVKGVVLNGPEQEEKTSKQESTAARIIFLLPGVKETCPPLPNEGLETEQERQQLYSIFCKCGYIYGAAVTTAA